MPPDKDLNLLLIEDDPFARDLMGMLLTRDWRTRLVGEVGSEEEVRRALAEPGRRIDAILLDTEVPDEANWLPRIAGLAALADPSPRILCTATKPDAHSLRQAVESGFGGYLIKKEIGYALGTAVSHSVKSRRFILTPSGYRAALGARLPLPPDSWLFDGTKPVAKLTPREAEIARLAILFNHPYNELSDELLIRADQVGKVVSQVYEKLGMDYIISGEIPPETIFDDEVILRNFRRILQQVAARKSKRKAADMPTLAFHLLTQPEMRQII